MILELKPEQQKLLERAAQSRMSPEQILDQASAVIREQYLSEVWMLSEREAIAGQIAEGFELAERGDLIEADRVLKDRRAKRRIA